MAFDTITRREQFSLDQTTAWKSLAVTQTSRKKGLAKKISVSVVAFTFAYLAITGSNTSAKVSEKAVKGAVAKSLTVENLSTQTKLTILGLEVESLTPLAVANREVKSKVIPQVVKKGGFDTIYIEAGKKFGVPWQLLAAIHHVETHQSGDTDKPNPSGAMGPMQFMPGTFEAYKQDGDGDGFTSVYDVDDAIYTAARHLAANGAGRGNAKGAIYNYNHSWEYVKEVLTYAIGLGY